MNLASTSHLSGIFPSFVTSRVNDFQRIYSENNVLPSFKLTNIYDQHQIGSFLQITGIPLLSIAVGATVSTSTQSHSRHEILSEIDVVWPATQPAKSNGDCTATTLAQREIAAMQFLGSTYVSSYKA